MSVVVADCDVLTFTLVHLSLGAEVQKLLADCERSLVTLDRVYRREAQAPLRAALDTLVAAGSCELVNHPVERRLEKREEKILQRVYRLAEKQYKVTSDNDRGLLAEAELRGAPLFTEDGPLRALAADRGQRTFDARDLVILLFELGRIDATRRDTLLGAIEARVRNARRPDPAAAQGRGSVASELCGPPPPQQETEGPAEPPEAA
jgi:hypothetical protein